MQNRLNYTWHLKKVSMLQNHYILFLSKLYETSAVCIKNCFVGVASHPNGKGAPKIGRWPWSKKNGSSQRTLKNLELSY